MAVRRLRILAVALFAAAQAHAAQPVDVSPPARRAVLGAALAKRLEAPLPKQGVRVSVVLLQEALPRQPAARRAAVAARQQRVLDALPAGSFELTRRYGVLSGFAGRARGRAIEALLNNPECALVYEDGLVHASLAQGTSLIGATGLRSQGVTGAGVKVAVLDTGIDSDHGDLVDDIVAQQCFCSLSGGCCAGGATQATTAEDDEGHGTAVSGIITSDGVQAAPGVAPDAEIVAVKILDSNGDGTFSDIAAALDWVLTQRAVSGGPVEGLQVVNMSLGDAIERNNPNVPPCKNSNTANAIEALEAAGVTVVVSSGNEAYDNGIAFPACVAQAISVGGVYDAALGSVSWCGPSGCTPVLCTDAVTAADVFVCHSNSDEILDVLAPNHSTRTSGWGGGVTTFGGTSASAPYIAGGVALLLEMDPTLTPAQVRTLLSAHGPPVTNPDNGLSFTRSDFSAAVSAVLPSTCGNTIVDPGEGCDDGAENGTTTCGCALNCQYPTSVKPCSDGFGCTLGGACDGTGTCVPDSLDDASCDNSLFCDGPETCDALLGCQPGVPPQVDDGVGCTDDSCDEVGDVVVNTPNDASCDNSLFCDGVETCDPVIDCQAGTPPVADDGVNCTADGCDEENDGIVHIPDDLLCDDSDPCTADSCDEILGCSNDFVLGCGGAVPASSRFGRELVAGFLLAAAALALQCRRNASTRLRK
ncbi:MAG: S8 family serine peptidase [Myxococcota bacterium]